MLQPASRVVIATSGIIIFWTIVGKLYFYRDPGSIFFDSRYAYRQWYSGQRLDDAAAFLDNTSEEGWTYTRSTALAEGGPVKPDTEPEFCLSVPTVHRKSMKAQYVQTAVASIVQGAVTPLERALLHVSVFFADANYLGHPGWASPWVKALTDDFWAVRESSTSVSAATKGYLDEMSYDGLQTGSKGTIDYTLALERCMEKTNAPYIAVFEDDVVLGSHWFAPTLAALRRATHVAQVHGKSKDKDWLLVRIFNQERSTGWKGTRIGDNHEFLIALGIDVAVLLGYFLGRKYKPSALTSQLIDHKALAVLCLFTIPAMIVMFFQSGKANVLPPADGLFVEQYGCCSQALIFNRRQVPALIDFLRAEARLERDTPEEEPIHYDLLTTFYANTYNFTRMSLYPMQVQHVGLKSSIGGTAAQSRAVWSMAFESYTESKALRRYRDAMQTLFGDDWKRGSSVHSIGSD